MLSDLESSFDAERRADLVAQSAELAEAEHASIEVVDRLRGTVGRPIHVRTRSGAPVDGVLTRVEPAYVLVDEGEGLQAIVPLAAVTTGGDACRSGAPEMIDGVPRWGRCCGRSLDGECGCA